MKRRVLLAAMLALPIAGRAQQAKVPRVGYLFSFRRADGEHLWQACRAGLRELGYVEGKTSSSSRAGPAATTSGYPGSCRSCSRSRWTCW